MSWGNVRDAIADGVEALTPTTATLGRARYTRARTPVDSYEGVEVDREFCVVSSSPSQKVGVVYETADHYITEAEVIVGYIQGRSVEEDEDRIEEDVRQIQGFLDEHGNHHADFWALSPRGSSPFTTTKTQVPSGGWLVSIGFTAHHS